MSDKTDERLPVFDRKLVADAILRATGANIHRLKSRIAMYINEFELVEKFDKKWSDVHWSSSRNQTRAEIVETLAKEIRLLTLQ